MLFLLLFAALEFSARFALRIHAVFLWDSVSFLAGTMEMDLVDDLELLDDYDDLEFDGFGVAAGDTSRQVRIFDCQAEVL